MINTLRYKNWDFTLDLQFVAGVQTLQQFYHSTYDRFGQTNGLTNILYDAYNGTNPNSMQQAIWLFNGGHAGQDTLTDSQSVSYTHLSDYSGSRGRRGARSLIRLYISFM